MSRNPEYQFVDTSVDALVSLLVQGYEQITGEAVCPSSPERVFIQWVASIVTHERVLTNYTGNQNIPSRADGENLDALAQLMYLPQRPPAQAAGCMQRFHISEPQLSAILVPVGTRVTSPGGLIWETVKDAYVNIGDTYADAPLRCQTVGAAGNGYTPGQLNTLVDIYDYYSATENLTTSDGGTDAATDEEFYQLMRASMDAYSCAGARGSYEYFAQQVSTEIGDVIANSPTPGVVKLYVLMDDGTLATDEIKAAVLAACNADTVRPLTDQVFVEDAEPVAYNIDFTYYTQTGSDKSAVEIQAAVEAAVQGYVNWQDTKLGRDINPSTLIGLLMQTGIKRVELREPVFTVLRDDNRSMPQVGQIQDITITNGGSHGGHGAVSQPIPWQPDSSGRVRSEYSCPECGWGPAALREDDPSRRYAGQRNAVPGPGRDTGRSYGGIWGRARKGEIIMAWGSVNAPGGGSAISWAGPPTAETPAQPGQHYYDSAGQKEYVCRGKDDEGRYIWELAGATDAADLTYRGLPLTEALAGLGGFWLIRDNIPPSERRSGVLYGLILQNWEG